MFISSPTLFCRNKRCSFSIIFISKLNTWFFNQSPLNYILISVRLCATYDGGYKGIMSKYSGVWNALLESQQTHTHPHTKSNMKKIQLYTWHWQAGLSVSGSQDSWKWSKLDLEDPANFNRWRLHRGGELSSSRTIKSNLGSYEQTAWADVKNSCKRAMKNKVEK